MIATLPSQLSMDLRIPQSCPLLPVKAVICLLSPCGVVSGEDVAELIDNGHLEYAFDLRRPGAAHALPVVWRGSLANYMARQDDSGESASHTRILNGVSDLEQVIDDILPDGVRSLRAVALKALFGFCDRKHVIRLIADGVLAVDPARPVGRGPAQSPWVTRASAAQFLRERRIV
jgi:hypothetical protein